MKLRSVLFLAAVLILSVSVVFSTVSDKEKKSTDKKDSKGCCDMKTAKTSKEKCTADMKECSSDKASMKSSSKDCCSDHDKKEAKADAKSKADQPKPKENDKK